jgi:hypothetical protein
VLVAPACAGSREGSDHFGSYVHSLSLHFYKRLFPGLEPMTSWSQGNSLTVGHHVQFCFIIGHHNVKVGDKVFFASRSIFVPIFLINHELDNMSVNL